MVGRGVDLGGNFGQVGGGDMYLSSYGLVGYLDGWFLDRHRFGLKNIIGIFVAML